MKDRTELQLVALKEIATMEVSAPGPLDGSRVVCFQLHDFKEFESRVFAMAQADLELLIRHLTTAWQQVAAHEAAMREATSG